MVGSSLASLLAHSWVSLDFDLASVSCQELNGKQQHDEKTVEGCGGATLEGKVTVGKVCRIEKVVNKDMGYISRWASAGNVGHCCPGQVEWSKGETCRMLMNKCK